MDTSIPALSVGAALLVIGGVMVRAHHRAWRQQKNDSTLDEFDRKHYYARYRRRMQTSAMIALIGILFAAGDAPWMANVWLRFPRGWGYYWAAVLLLTVWVVALALGDLSSTRAHSKVALARVHRKQRELEAQVVELKRQRSNGHPGAN